MNAGKPEKLEEIRAINHKLGRFWPLGVLATSVAGVALGSLRGCWHRRMSWPVRMQSHSYQVCLECGVKRLFDEDRFCSYGPFRYDLAELIAWEREKEKEKEIKKERQKHAQSHPLPPASEIIGPEIIGPEIIRQYRSVLNLRLFVAYVDPGSHALAALAWLLYHSTVRRSPSSKLTRTL